MGMGVGGVAAAPSLEIRGEGARSSPHFSKPKFISPQADATDNSPELGDVRSPVITVAPAVGRRAAALDASIDDVLIAAGAHACEQLKSTWPGLSAATLHTFTKIIPLLLGALAVVLIFTTPGMIGISIIVALPMAFRIWVIAYPMTASADSFLCPSFLAPPDEEWPVYSVIAALRGEAAVVDQLL